MSIITVADANDNKSKDKGGSSLSSGMVSSRLSMDYGESLIRKKQLDIKLGFGYIRDHTTINIMEYVHV